MRRVPMSRRTIGDDDPQANVPVRGRPLQPGHPWRFQPGNTAGRRRPAERMSDLDARADTRARVARPAAERTRTQRPISAVRSDPVPPETAPVSPVSIESRGEPIDTGDMRLGNALDAMRSLMRDSANRGRTGDARKDVPRARPEQRRQRRAPQMNQVRQSEPVRIDAGAYPDRACGQCAKDGIRDARGLWPAAVARVGLWQADRAAGVEYLCTEHVRRLEQIAREQPELLLRMHIY